MENNPNPALVAPAAPAAAPAGAGKTIDKNLHVWAWCFLLGWLGIDRFMRGQIGLGIAKIFFGWCFWNLIDWIIALSKAYGSSYGSDKDFTFDANGNYTK